jgi:hypothetical protein
MYKPQENLTNTESGSRQPTTYLINKAKVAGLDSIHPPSAIRFVKSFIEDMPSDWQGLEREGLITKVREHCERGASSGCLSRKRVKNIKGYVYFIKA